jgi:hypothetical protein
MSPNLTWLPIACWNSRCDTTRTADRTLAKVADGDRFMLVFLRTLAIAIGSAIFVAVFAMVAPTLIG